jgi:hypothetical protein
MDWKIRKIYIFALSKDPHEPSLEWAIKRSAEDWDYSEMTKFIQKLRGRWETVWTLK